MVLKGRAKGSLRFGDSCGVTMSLSLRSRPPASIDLSKVCSMILCMHPMQARREPVCWPCLFRIQFARALSVTVVCLHLVTWSKLFSHGGRGHPQGEVLQVTGPADCHSFVSIGKVGVATCGKFALHGFAAVALVLTWAACAWRPKQQEQQ